MFDDNKLYVTTQTFQLKGVVDNSESVHIQL